MDVIRRDKRRGRNTHTSDEHVNILLRLGASNYMYTGMVLIFIDKDS